MMLFGSDEFSCEFARNSREIIGSVFTIGKRMAGRGLTQISSLLSGWALREGLPFFECDTPDSADAENFVKKINPKAFLIASFGKKIPKRLYSIPEFGGVNVHPSLLPKYRGMAPVARALMNGEKVTGVTLHKLSDKIDSGDMISQREIFIDDEDDDMSLKLKLASIAAEMAKEVFNDPRTYLSNAIVQNEDDATWAKRIHEKDRMVFWQMPSRKIHDTCRALYPSPTACFMFKDKKIQLLKTSISSCDFPVVESQILSINPLMIKTLDGAVNLLKVKPPSKKEMSGTDFANGSRLKKGDLLI